MRLLHRPMVRVVLAILIGFGLATLFRPVCTRASCMNFVGVAPEDMDAVFAFGDKCYSFMAEKTKCVPSMLTVKIA